MIYMGMGAYGPMYVSPYDCTGDASYADPSWQFI